MAQRKIRVQVEVSNGRLINTSNGDLISPQELKSHSKLYDYRIVSADDTDLAVGVHIDQYQKSSLKFLQDLTNYTDQNMSNIHNQIDICNKMFMFEDVVSTGVDILIDFATTPFEIIGKTQNEKVNKIVDWFIDNVNKKGKSFSDHGLHALNQTIAHEWFLAGNVIPAEAWSDVIIDGESFKMPDQIELLNPLHIKVSDQAFLAGDKDRLFWTISPNVTTGGFDDVSTVKDMFRDVDQLKTAIEKNPIFSGKPFVNPDDPNSVIGVPLNPERVSHLKRKARHYNQWGVPYLTKAIQPVTYKQKLWQLDMNTIEGMINYITVFKIGSPDVKSPYHKVPRKRLTDFANVLKNPQGSTALIWPHDIEIITAGPSGEVLNFSDKYQEANRAIIQALGVPPILIDGSGAATAAWVAVLAMVERLEKVRESIANYIEHILMKIGEANDMVEEFSKLRLNWQPVNLRNEAEVKNLLLAFHDRGLLPIQTTHTEGGYNHEDLKELMLVEEQDGLRKLFVRPDIPFASNPGDQTNKDGRPVDKVKTQDESTSANLQFNKNDYLIRTASNDLIGDRLKETISSVFGSMEDEISGMAKKTQKAVSDSILIGFVRLSQATEIFISTALDSNDVVFAQKTQIAAQENITKIQKFLTDKMVKLVAKKNSSDRELMMTGVMAQASKRLDMFVTESLRSVTMAQTLLDKQNEGFVGAVLNTPEDTECEFCKAMNGEFLTLIEISDELPFHPHQRFTLSWQTEDLIVTGKKKKKVLKKIVKPKSIKKYTKK